MDASGDQVDQEEGLTEKAIPGWQVVLMLLLASRQSERSVDMDPEVRSPGCGSGGTLPWFPILNVDELKHYLGYHQIK